MRRAIDHLTQEVTQLRHPSFTQNQIELLLPSILSELHKLNVSVEKLKVFAVSAEKTLSEHTSAIADLKEEVSNRPAFDYKAAFQAGRDALWPEVQKELNRYRDLLILHLPRVPSTDVERQTSDENPFEDADKSTVDMSPNPESPNVLTVTQADHSADPVLHTTSAPEIVHTGSNDSEMQLPIETAVDPINSEWAVPEVIQDIGLSTDVEQAVAKPNQDANPSTGLVIPPSDTTSEDLNALDDPERAEQDAVDTDREGMGVSSLRSYLNR